MKPRSNLPVFTLLLLTACATVPERRPISDVPLGTYVLVDPAPPEYNAVTINENAWSLRSGDEVVNGTHWIDSDDMLHIVSNDGPCGGMDSVYRYSYENHRLTLDRVSDACGNRDAPAHMVYEHQP